MAKPSSSSPSAPPSVSSIAPTQSLTSLSDDAKLEECVHSVLASFFFVGQGSLGINPFLSALAEVPDESPQNRGSAGGERLLT